MTRSFRRRGAGPALCVCLALGGVLLPSWALALSGSAVSPADTLDSLPPSVAVDHPTGGELFTGLVDETLQWTVTDGSIDPGADISLTVFDEGGAIWQDTAPFAADGLHELIWNVADLNTETARFAVSVSDRYGWAAADTGEVFMIQSLTSTPGARILADGLDSIHPNPFNPSTRIEFSLREAAEVELGVYDARGRRVTVISSGPLPQGRHAAVWDGRDAHGRPVSSGTYLARLSVRSEGRQGTHVERMTLVK